MAAGTPGAGGRGGAAADSTLSLLEPVGGRCVWSKADVVTRQRPPGLPYSENDRISYAWSGDYLLAAQDCIGAHPRTYRGGRLVWSSDAARAATFWPRRGSSSDV